MRTKRFPMSALVKFFFPETSTVPVWRVKQRVVAIILKVHILVVVWIGCVVEPREGILVPDNVDVLKEYIVP